MTKAEYARFPEFAYLTVYDENDPMAEQITRYHDIYRGLYGGPDSR